MSTPTPAPHYGTINAQTPGPAFAESHGDPQWAVKVGKRSGFHYIAITSQANDEANARLLAASYTAFDRAGRQLNHDAADLAQRIDLAALITQADHAVAVLEQCGQSEAAQGLRAALGRSPNAAT